MSNKWNRGAMVVIAACGLAAGLFPAGCATTDKTKVPPVTVGDIVKMSKDGLPPSEIIARIHQSGTVYRLKASELAKLKEQGVSDEVIDYMQKTYIHALQRDQQLEDARYWTRWEDGYWYGGLPFGWPFDPLLYGPPVVIVREPNEGMRTPMSPRPGGGHRHD